MTLPEGSIQVIDTDEEVISMSIPADLLLIGMISVLDLFALYFFGQFK